MEQTRVCAYCLTRQPLAALAQVADHLECDDRHACEARALSSGIYPMAADADVSAEAPDPADSARRITQGPDPASVAIERIQRAERRADQAAMADPARLKEALDLT